MPTEQSGERGLLSAQGTLIKHETQILHLLEAVQKPAKVAIMHCRAHQTNKIGPKYGNYLANRVAKEAAEKGIRVLVLQWEISLPDINPEQSAKDCQLIEALYSKFLPFGWAVIVIARNSFQENKMVIGAIKSGNSPGDYWQIDFTELPCKVSYKYLLVLVNTFSGWPEVFPCCTNMAKEVVKILLNQIILHFGVPLGMPSDRRPHFIARIVEQVSKALEIQRDLHTPYRP